tara:strand:- start:994 stop:1236 length:243 start_codon:yes stop_codon:yes gene_type:complete
MNEIYHGILKHSKEIILPEEWTELVKQDTITVCITPIGSHQNIIVRGIQGNKITLQSNSGMPIECYYHVVGEKIDKEEES